MAGIMPSNLSMLVISQDNPSPDKPLARSDGAVKTGKATLPMS